MKTFQCHITKRESWIQEWSINPISRNEVVQQNRYSILTVASIINLPWFISISCSYLIKKRKRHVKIQTNQQQWCFIFRRLFSHKIIRLLNIHSNILFNYKTLTEKNKWKLCHGLKIYLNSIFLPKKWLNICRVIGHSRALSVSFKT